MRRKPRLAEADTGLMRNIMTQQPAMPSRHVCQVKYRKVGLEQGGGDTRYHAAPTPAVVRAQQGGLYQGAKQPPLVNSTVPAPDKQG